MSDHSINLTDVTRQPHPDPCPDCGREHMNGEHISLTVPASDGGTRTVWEGCADCWAKRTDPKNVTTEARDAAVAARALREAATDAAYGIDWDDVPESVESWLHDRADRIEREAGESDADA